MRTTSTTPPLCLPEADARAVAFLFTLEQEDRTGELLAHAERRRATAEAFEAASGSEPRWIAARARDLVALLERDAPFLPRYLRLTRPARGLLAPVLLLAFGLGVAADALGPERRIHVLALPLLGLIAWNVAMILVLIGSRLLPTVRAFERPWLAGFLEGWVGRLAGGQPERWQEVLRADLAFWLPATAPLVAARVRRLLHLAALTLLAGAVFGMYLRGIGFAYRASWESTFLSAGVVDALLGTVLGPAAWLLGTEVPSAALIESPATGEAAPWIHLWAVTAAVFVGVPRIALASWERLRCLRLEHGLPLPLADSYRRRLRATAQTVVERWTVWPYSFSPPPSAAAALKGLLLDLAGARADIRLVPLEYGAELPVGGEEAGGRAVVFNLAQTPEDEVHGALLAALRRGLPAGEVLLVLVDGSAYRRQLGGGESAERRLEERRRVWNRMVEAQGLRAVHLELQAPAPEGTLAALAAAAWPAGALGGRD